MHVTRTCAVPSVRRSKEERDDWYARKYRKLIIPINPDGSIGIG